MAKLFSIFMSGLILIQSFDIAFNDIAQFDELLEHAQFHAEEYGDSLFVFISKHYGELKDQHDKEHQEEKKEHDKLPFQNHYGCASSVAIVTDTSFLRMNCPQIPESKTTNFYYHPPISSLHAQGLFQPPRIS